MNAMDHAKWRDVKTTDAFWDLIGRCYYCDDVAALKLSKYNRELTTKYFSVGDNSNLSHAATETTHTKGFNPYFIEPP